MKKTKLYDWGQHNSFRKKKEIIKKTHKENQWKIELNECNICRLNQRKQFSLMVLKENLIFFFN